MPGTRKFLFGGVAIVAIVIGALSAQFMRREPVITLVSGTLLQPARVLPGFQLLDNHGQPYSQTRLLGQWSVVFFGFTHCPDICPTTLSMLSQVDKALADLPAKQRPQFVFISVDPKRDTPEQLNNYVSFFNPGFSGLTGEQAQIDVLTKALGVPVAIQDQGEGNYSMDHSAAIFVLNPQAQFAALFSAPHTVQTLSADLRSLIQQSSP
jgi:protein SCO1/2